MNPYKTDLPIAHLKPGDLYVLKDPALIVTVLGSCVSVTMFNARLKIGGICHGILPWQKNYEKVVSADDINVFRYMDRAIDYMLRKFYSFNVSPREIEVKIFGGASMLAEREGVRKVLNVGQQNIQAARDILEAEKLIIIDTDVGGNQGRKILFYTGTGKVLLKRLTKINQLKEVFEKEYSSYKGAEKKAV